MLQPPFRMHLGFHVGNTLSVWLLKLQRDTISQQIVCMALIIFQLLSLDIYHNFSKKCLENVFIWTGIHNLHINYIFLWWSPSVEREVSLIREKTIFISGYRLYKPFRFSCHIGQWCEKNILQRQERMVASFFLWEAELLFIREE